MKARWAVLRRAAHIARVLAQSLFAHAVGSRLPRLAARLGIVPLSGPERLRATFERLGGTFLKLGQMLALQPDILSLEYCNELFNLMDRVPAVDFEQVDAMLRAELGGGAEELFDRFDRRPLATASIAQVHAAWSNGAKVAVKVQRPTVERDFLGDIRLMSAGIRMIERLHIKPLAWLVDPLSEFVRWTHEELDFRCEARYLERMGALSGGSPGEVVPALIGSRSARRVLTAGFLDGVTVLDYLRALESGDELFLARMRAGGFDANQFARNVIGNFLGDAFHHGMFHADLHPANLMILPGSAVGYIDFGITGVLSVYSRRHLVELTLAYIRGDLAAMCQAFYQVSSIGPQSDPAAFAAGLERLADDWYERVGGEKRLRKNFTLVMLDMLNLSRATGVLPERDVVKYIRSSIAIDGLITRFAPGFDVGHHLGALCERYLQHESLFAGMSSERLLSWSLASASVLRDGALRGNRILDRVLAGEQAVGGAPAGRPRRVAAALHRRTAHLAATALGLAALLGAADARTAFGVNLFTAEALLAAACLAMLLATVWRLV